MASTALGGLVPGAAFAQAQTSNRSIAFDIPAQPLGQALAVFSQQAGVDIVYGGAVPDVRSPGVSGKLSAGEALSRLLTGTGFTYRFTGANSVTLEPAPDSAGAVQLGPVRVEGSATAGLAAGESFPGTYAAPGASRSATGLTLSVRETPQTVTVITRQQMEDQALFRLPDVLRQVPGLSYTQADSERFGFSIRGFDVGNYRQDGMAASTYPTGAYGSLYRSNFDMAVYERIEVVKGATGLMSGAGDPGASVNLVRKRPGRAFAAYVDASLGSWDFRRIEADVTGPLVSSGAVRGRVVGAFEDKEDFFDYYSRRKYVLFGSLEADLTPSTLVGVNVTHSDHDVRGMPWGGTFPVFYSDGTRTDLPRSFSHADNWTSWTAKSTTIAADLEQRIGSDWTLKASYSHQDEESRLLPIFWEGYPARDGSGLYGYRDDYPNHMKRDAFSVTLNGYYSLFGMPGEVSAGYTHVRTRSEDINIFDEWGFGPSDFFAIIGNIPEITGADRYLDSTVTTRTRENSFYASTRLSPIEGVSLILGARLNDWSSRRASLSGTRETVTAYSYKNEFTPYAGLVVDLSRTLSVYASYTDIFTPQNFRDAQGELLEPIQGEALEAGIKGSFADGRLNATLAVFRITQDNLAEATGDFLGSQPIYVGIKGARSTGFEAELAGEIAPGWQVQGGFTYQNVEDASGARVRTTSPSTTLKLFTTYRLPDRLDRLTLGGGVRWQSKAWRDEVGPDNDGIAGTADDRLTQGSYAVVDLMARYQITDGLSLAVNLNNLFDEKYYTAFNQKSTWGQPRNLMVSLRHKW